MYLCMCYSDACTFHVNRLGLCIFTVTYALYIHPKYCINWDSSIQPFTIHIQLSLIQIIIIVRLMEPVARVFVLSNSKSATCAVCLATLQYWECWILYSVCLPVCLSVGWSGLSQKMLRRRRWKSSYPLNTGSRIPRSRFYLIVNWRILYRKIVQ